MAALAAASKPLRPTPAMPASPPIFVSISCSIERGYGRDRGGGGGRRAEMGSGRTGVEDGNGTVPGAGWGTAVLGGLGNDAARGANGFCAIEGCCESAEGRRASREGRSLSRDGDVSRDGREVDGVRARSNDGRGRIFEGGLAFGEARSVNGDCGGARGCGIGGGVLSRADESGDGRRGTGWPGGSLNWIGKAARAGEMGAVRLALEGLLARCKTGGTESRTGVEMRSGGGVGAPGNRGRSRSSGRVGGGGEFFGKGTLVAFGVTILDLSGGSR